MKKPHSFNELLEQIKVRKVSFFIVFFFVVLLTYSILYAIDFVPEPVESEATKAATVETDSIVLEVEPAVAAVVEPLPLTIIFDSLDAKSIPVLNPQSREIADLDEALLEGVVRHPDSADFNEVGNIFILGHSSYLPNVLNRNFQAFNGIQNLTWGDRIRLQSADTEYVYRVERVYKAAASELIVPFTPGEARLTLATCNSFGSKDDRYIVEATLIGKQSLI
jgi:LPXTG-site transpeptidase (sortase) family protein